VWAEESGPVKLGVLTDMSSVYSDQTGAGVVEAVKMAAADIGPVLGHPVEVIFAESQLKADVASTIARKWWDTGEVDTICDIGGSAVALAVMHLATTKKKIALASSPGSSDITGKLCSPYTTQWTYDTYGNATTLGRYMLQEGGNTWFFIAADYSFGASLVADTTAVIENGGGKVLGVARHPLNSADFSSYLLQAQASGAKVIGFANGGSDTINSIKQAAEFGLMQGGQRLGVLVLMDTDVKSIGLDLAQGIVFPTAFYWDRTDDTRKWSRRFYDKIGRMPTMFQAGAFSHALHYLKAVQAAATKDADQVMAKMRESPVNDFFAQNGVVRPDGRMVHDMYLAQVKTPAESKEPWDQFKILATVAGDRAFRPMSEGGCPLVQ
jgi:branched-chain amino acid transport system substrate-binding protein